MRNVAFFVAISVAIMSLFCFPAAECSAELLLNEILADPASDWDGDGSVGSRADEWVEVINAGSSSIDLSDYRLGDLSGGYEWRYGFNGSLAPGEVVLVYGSAAQVWQSEHGFSAVGLSLNNAGDTVFLYRIDAADTTVVDSYAYQTHEVADDRSAGRTSPAPGEWVIFDALNPYTGDNPPLGNGCVPTPALANECTPEVPVKGATWGAIKHRYDD
jgi:hypothetical protein